MGNAALEERGANTPVDDRRGYLGGSDASVILGLNPWKSPTQLYLEKRGEVEPDDLSENERVQWGNLLEDIVATRYAEVTGKKLRRENRMLFHETYPFIAAHIDRRIVGEHRPLEVKTTGSSAGWGAPYTDEIPEYYYPQVQHYLGVFGGEQADVAVLIGGNTFRIYHVPRNDQYIDALFRHEAAFWKRVETGNPPDPATSAEANLRWPHTRTGQIEVDFDTLLQARELYQVEQQIKALTAQKDELQTALKSAMGEDGDTITYQGARIATWKEQTANRFDTKQFREDHPELFAEYQKESHSRVFRFQFKGEE